MLQSTIKQFPSSTGIYLPPGASKRGPIHDGVVSVALGQQQATSFDGEQLSFNVIFTVLQGLGQLNGRAFGLPTPIYLIYCGTIEFSCRQIREPTDGAISFNLVANCLAMRVLEDLPTPCLLIDERRMEANLEQMAIKADGVGLRPHTKTHKSVALAKRQQLRGAVGITVAKVSEAEIFVQNGFDDVRIAYTLVGDQQLRRLADLSSQARISFCVDTKEGAHLASSVLGKTGVSIDVLLEIDTGYGRCGVPYNSNEVVELALELNELEGLRLCGILTHEGNAYSHNALNATEVMAQTRDRMLDVAVRLAEAHCAEAATFEISMGSTPSINVFENNSKGGFCITEVRPGNYIFNDLTQVALGVCSLDACALTVLSTVVSRHRTSRGTERFILDSGRKVLTSDSVRDKPGYGCILYNPRTRVAHPHTRITGLSEEHGWCEVQGGGTFSVGDRVQIVPNHACVVVNMMDKIFLVDGSTVLSEIPVDARGCVI